ncbi:Amino-acid acetyltransferase, mitochondrial [Dipsacomyces acuminosporus]|nr:Amino-acid acetyltransferase, mitochondrial [Dipsacomyces acuminosporus]
MSLLLLRNGPRSLAPRIGGRLFGSVSTRSDESLAGHNHSSNNQRERELIFNVLSTQPSPREARKFLNSVRGSETLKHQREFEEYQAKLASIKEEASAKPVYGELLRKKSSSIDSKLNQEQIVSDIVVPRRLTSIVFVDDLADGLAYKRVGKLLAQIQRLGVVPIVLLSTKDDSPGYREAIKQVHGLADAIESEGGKARPINEGIFYSNPFTQSELSVDPELLGSAISQNQIPIIAPIVANVSLKLSQLNIESSAALLIKTLSNCCSSTNLPMPGTKGEFSLLLARLIYLTKHQGITNDKGFQRFVNLEQDFDHVLSNGCQQGGMLGLMRNCLEILPPTAAGIVASVYSDPSLVMKGLISERPVSTNAVSNVVEKRDNRALADQIKINARPDYKPLANYPFVNLPTKPQIIVDDAKATKGDSLRVVPNQFTLLRHGFKIQQHTALETCDLPRLQALLESSFKRKLDNENYFDRLKSLKHGFKIIVAGDYEGAVIVTYESSGDKGFAYLDKFAVLPDVQGTGMADILWTQLVTTAGNCLWRSRNDNGVNKWYFDRSHGHFRSPVSEDPKSTRWVFFWYQDRSSSLSMSDIQNGIDVANSIPASFI